ncbi:MAG: hypothetical protein ABI390_07635 [Daejeonella sp.]
MQFSIKTFSDHNIEFIFQSSEGLLLEVINLNTNKFIEDSNEIQFFGDIDDQHFAFQTINYQEDNLAHMIDAIRFYACRQGYPFMEITTQRSMNVA